MRDIICPGSKHFSNLRASLETTRCRSTAFLLLTVGGLLALFVSPSRPRAQDWFTTGINRGAPLIRLALPESPSRSLDPQAVNLAREYNQVLWNDLENAGIFDMVSRSMYPLKPPQDLADINFKEWADPPAAAQFLVFGHTEVVNGQLVIYGYVNDVKNPANASVLAKRFVATLNEVATRQAAHRFANEIIQTLGGGIPGIDLTQIAFVSNRTGFPEIWLMDYDGFNQHPLTSYRSYSTTPRWSPDNSRLAFTSYAESNPDIYVFSLLTNRRVVFPKYKGLTTTPAWSPDGKNIAFCSSMSGDPEIYSLGLRTNNLQRLTFSPGVDISPAWNPKTGNELAFVSDRSGSPQIYMMSADGSNVRRLTSQGGDASSPSWSPNGLLVAFHWRISDTGTYDIYVAEVATGRIVQLTHDAGRNEHPTWSPDGRHLAFESDRTGRKQVWIMLADGTNPKQLTENGANWNPNWSN